MYLLIHYLLLRCYYQNMRYLFVVVLVQYIVLLHSFQYQEVPNQEDNSQANEEKEEEMRQTQSPVFDKPPDLKLYDDKGQPQDTYYFQAREQKKMIGIEDYDEEEGLKNKVKEARETMKLQEGTPAPPLEQSEFFEDPLGDTNRGKTRYGSGNFKGTKRCWRPRFLVKADFRKISPQKTSKVKWLKIAPPDFCQESILIHRECDSYIESPLKRHEYRWSFNLEDGGCYLYVDPCPLFKRNSFRNLFQCIATCWCSCLKK